MRPLVPLLEHRRDATFTPAISPRAMMVTPARTPEEEPEGSQREEEEQEYYQEAKETKAKAPGAVEGHSVAIIRIRQWCGLT